MDDLLESDPNVESITIQLNIFQKIKNPCIFQVLIKENSDKRLSFLTVLTLASEVELWYDYW